MPPGDQFPQVLGADRRTRAVGSDQHLTRRRAAVGEERGDGAPLVPFVRRELLPEVDPALQAIEQQLAQRRSLGRGHERGEEIRRQALLQRPATHRVDRDPGTSGAIGAAALRLVKRARHSRPAKAVSEREPAVASAHDQDVQRVAGAQGARLVIFLGADSS